MKDIWNELSEKGKEIVSKEYIMLKERFDRMSKDNSRYEELRDEIAYIENIFGYRNLASDAIKTWDDIELYYPELEKSLNDLCDSLSNYDADRKLINKIEATFQIYYLIRLGYGGIVTTEEWRDYASVKYCISAISKRLGKTEVYDTYEFIAFHTKEQRDEFYNNNEQLCKNYYMIYE